MRAPPHLRWPILLEICLLIALPARANDDPPERGPGRAEADRDARILSLLEEKGDGGFRVHRGRRFTIFSDDHDLDLAAYGRNLERGASKIAGALAIRHPEGGPRLPVIHFEDRDAYSAFCEGTGIESYAAKGRGCYAPRLPGKPVIVRGRVLSTLLHETSHQIAEAILGPGLRDAAWVAEGLGALFEAYPPEAFFRHDRYEKGRDRILAEDFDLREFASDRGRRSGIYEVGATIHAVFLFGPDRARYLRWLHALARGEAEVADLPAAMGLSWGALSERLRKGCRERDPGGREAPAGDGGGE